MFKKEKPNPKVRLTCQLPHKKCSRRFVFKTLVASVVAQSGEGINLKWDALQLPLGRDKKTGEGVLSHFVNVAREALQICLVSQKLNVLARLSQNQRKKEPDEAGYTSIWETQVLPNALVFHLFGGVALPIGFKPHLAL